MTVKSNQQKKFQYLRHTADAKFQAFGETLELAFANAVLALASLMWDPSKISPAVKVEVTVDGKDWKQLLMVFLEELLFLLDTRNFLLHSVQNVIIQEAGPGYVLQGVFWGDMADADAEIFGSVKAVTYHEMEVHTGDRFLVQVVVDM